MGCSILAAAMVSSTLCSEYFQCIHGDPQLQPSEELLETAKAKARGRARADRASIHELDERIRPFVGAASGVNLQLEYQPDSNGSN